MNLYTFFLLFSAAHYSRAKKLSVERRVCKTELIRIPTKKSVPSDPIRLQFGSTEQGDAVRKVLHEECSKFIESQNPRSKRSFRKLVSFASSNAKKIGQTVSTSVKKMGRAGMRKAGKLRWGSKSGIGKKGVKSGVKVGQLLDLGNDFWDVAETVVETVPEIIRAFNPESSSSEEQENEWEQELKELRRDAEVLLQNKTLEGVLLSHPSVQKILQEELRMLHSFPVLNIKCNKNFIGVYQLEFQVDVPEYVTVEAKKCGDIGRLNDGFYEYLELPDSSVVERDGETFSVNGTACIQTNNNTFSCPEDSLQVDNCSVESTEACKIHIEELGEEMIRKLPEGVVYYGPAEMILLTHKNIVYKFAINPYHLEYVRIPESSALKIGEKVVN